MADVSVNAWDWTTWQSGESQTSSDGAYRFTLMPGTYAINVYLPPESGLPRQRMRIVQATEDRTLDIRLEAVTLSGRVTDPEANPVGGVSVEVWSSMGGWGWTETSSDGAYHFTLMPGTY